MTWAPEITFGSGYRKVSRTGSRIGSLLGSLSRLDGSLLGVDGSIAKNGDRRVAGSWILVGKPILRRLSTSLRVGPKITFLGEL